jgi:iron-sulfur cluster assembly protein
MTVPETAIQTQLPVSFSEKAISALHDVMRTENVGDSQALRVGVKGGGCSGMSYVLAFDTPTEHDQHYEVGGLRVVMDKRHLMYLMGMHVDFQDGLNARGFAFQNPNAKTTCGCGTSFSA